MVPVHGLVEVVVTALDILNLFDGEGLGHGLVPLQLVALQGRHTVASPVAEGPCNPLLATHGVERHDAAVQHQGPERFREDRDLVGPGIHPARAQDPGGLAGHGHDLPTR